MNKKNLENKIILYSDIDKKNGICLDNVYWGREKKFFSSIHSISYYLAMFSPSLPCYFIKKYSKENDTIMDNFSGRGTTALVSREKNRKFIGNDLNPYAYVMSKLKIDKLNKSDLLKKIDEIEKEYNNSYFLNKKINNRNSVFRDIVHFYSKKTLRQLYFLRENYGINWLNNSNEINAILAFALGLMHGPTRKDGTTIYFSLKMPNTISMSPNYVKNYSMKHGLKKPDVNIFEQIKNRINKKYDWILNENYEGKIFLWDSTKINPHIKDESVDLVITSPPYLSIVNYTKSNWLKLWLLGFDRDGLNRNIVLSDTLNFNDYICFIEKYLNAIHSKLKSEAKVCLVVGDIFDHNLIEEVWKKIEKKVEYKFVEIYYDYKYKQTKKVTNMLGNKSGKATKIDKVLVIKKNKEHLQC